MKININGQAVVRNFNLYILGDIELYGIYLDIYNYLEKKFNNLNIYASKKNDLNFFGTDLENFYIYVIV